MSDTGSRGRLAVPECMVEGHHPSVAAYITSKRIATGYDRTFADTALFRTDTVFLADELPPPPARVMDLGCGTGRHVVHLARAGYDVTAIDLSGHMLSLARKKLAEEGLAARLEQADICDLSAFADGEFDAAVCMFSTLGLLRGRELRRRAFAEAARVIRPGGIYCFHVHNVYNCLTQSGGGAWLARSLVDSLLGRAELGDKMMRSYRGEVDLYLHLFSRREALRLASGAGLEVRRVLALNERRDGEIRGPGSTMRANGFIISAGRPD